MMVKLNMEMLDNEHTSNNTNKTSNNNTHINNNNTNNNQNNDHNTNNNESIENHKNKTKDKHHNTSNLPPCCTLFRSPPPAIFILPSVLLVYRSVSPSSLVSPSPVSVRCFPLTPFLPFFVFDSIIILASLSGLRCLLVLSVLLQRDPSSILPPPFSLLPSPSSLLPP